MGSPMNLPLPQADPEQLGFIPERLARLGPALQRFIDEERVPNLVTLVARHGQIAHFDVQGYADVEQKKPTAGDSIFRLYSNSKPIAGLGIMLLFEDGILTPDDPISRFFPAFKDAVVRVADQPANTEPARREITIRDCLRHTSGLATPGRTPLSYRGLYAKELETTADLAIDSFGAGARTARERVEALARIPLSFHPGSQYEYHAGYIVVGAIIEEATGRSLNEFYHERVFDPLGMVDTDFYLDEADFDRFTTSYRPAFDGNRWSLAAYDRPETSEKRHGPKTFFSSGGDDGGLLGTISDYTRFGQMLLNGGELDGVRILGRKSVELMTADHSEGMIIPMHGPGIGWGLGVAVRHGNGGLPLMRSIGSYGWAGAAGTQYLADPKEDLLLVCFTQLMARQTRPGNTYWEEFERIAYQSLA